MANRNVRIRLNKRAVRNQAMSEIERNMNVAMVWLRDRIKEKLNRGQPTRTTPGGNLIGLDPSLPGEPPKKLSGVLQGSVRSGLRKRAREIIGLVGTNVKYAPPLEFGNRDGTLKPRPAWRVTLLENRRKLLRIVALGLDGI